MIFIPGVLINWATFPGVVIHELAHKLACDSRGIRVTEVTYFSLSGSGSVSHHPTRRFTDTLAVSTAPFFVNTIVALACYIGAIALVGPPAAINPPTDAEGFMALLLAWLGLSIGWHAIPSSGDTNNVWADVQRHWRSSALAALSIPIVLLLYVANALRFVWFDAIYSIALASIAVALLWPSILGGLSIPVLW